MAKHVQDEFLRVTVNVNAEGKSRKTWFLLGKRMGPKCILAILGVGNARLARVGQGRLDRRFAVWGGASCQGNCVITLHIILLLGFPIELGYQ